MQGKQHKDDTTMKETRFYIQKPLDSTSVKIFAIRETPTDRAQITLDRGSFLLYMTALDPNIANTIQPLLELPTGFFDEFVLAIVDYANENHIKTEDQTLLQGKYEAAQLHLSDMRKLVFKDKI